MKNLIILLLLIISSHSIFSGDERTLKLYLDADRVGTAASGKSIEQGIRLALSEINNEIAGFEIELVVKNHHGNDRRSRLNMEAFHNDPDALALFCGLHSSPVLKNLNYINENGILLLDPWAAAGPITRSSDEDGINWIFRLSVDDSKAGEVIVSHAIDKEKFKKPVLLLEDTGWGQSNKKTMLSALKSRGMNSVEVVWFRWGISKNGTREMLNDIYLNGADVILFVGNAPEGEVFFSSMSERAVGKRVPIRSHWGITGGNLFGKLGSKLMVEDLDLKFIQTSYSFLKKEQSVFATELFQRAKNLFEDIDKPEDIKAPCGFIHSYDLTRILIEAIKQANLTDDMVLNRAIVRLSLEQIENSVDGLIKNYKSPFSKYSEMKSSAHEALGIEDLRMARYREDGGIEVLER